MSRKRKTFPTDSLWLFEQGDSIVSRSNEIDHTLGETLRDALETLHSPTCQEDLCHPTCDFSLLIAHYYEQLSISEMVKRYNFRNKGSITYRLDRARERLREATIYLIGYDPYENTREVIER